MKTNQKREIVKTLLKKQSLTTLQCALLGLGVKLPSRIAEIEEELDIRFNREWERKNKSMYYRYSFKETDKKKLLKYSVLVK